MGPPVWRCDMRTASNWKDLVFALAFLIFMGMNIVLASPENRWLAAAIQALVFYYVLTFPPSKQQK